MTIEYTKDGYDYVGTCTKCGESYRKNYMSDNYAYTNVGDRMSRHQCPPKNEVLHITVEETEYSWEYGEKSGSGEFRTGSNKEVNDQVRRIISWFPDRETAIINGESEDE